jgi:hypothetical protein
VAQDSLDDGDAVDQADDLERAAATRANQRVRFVGSRFILHLPQYLRRAFVIPS